MTEKSIDLEKRVQQFVELRDKIAAVEAKHKEELAPYRAVKEKLENTLLDYLNTINSEAARTKFGTVTKSTKQTASLADADAFMRHVIGTGSFDLMDRRANVTACVDFAEANGAPPPGVNINSRSTIGVRRA